MLPAKRRLRNSQPQFMPRQLFAAMQGAWFEPVIGNMWQENTGVTPVSAPTQTVGLLLDQSQSMVLGPELITDANLIVAGDGLTRTVNVSNPIYLGIVLSSNKFYRVTYSFVSTSGNYSFRNAVYPGGSGIGFSGGTPQSKSIVCVGTTVVNEFTVTDDNGTANAVLDYLSVKQIFGNHAYQATAGNLPTYQLGANSLPLIRYDTTDYLTVSLPNLGGGVFSISGSVYFATVLGMSALHNQSMGTTYNLPALSTDVYAWCVFPQRLNAAQEAQLERYMLRKAGLVEQDYLWEVFIRNLLTYSEQFDNSYYTSYGTGSITANQATAPDGTLTADLLSISSTNGGRYLMKTGWYIGSSMTVSLYVKQATQGSYCQLCVGNFGAAVNDKRSSILVNTETGQFVSQQTSNHGGISGFSYSISAVGNGWFRLSVSGILSNANYGFFIEPASSSTPSFNASTLDISNNVSGNNLYIWGAQLELGTIATPYQRIDDGPDPYVVIPDALLMDDSEQIILRG